MTDNRNDVSWPDFTDATIHEPLLAYHRFCQGRHDYFAGLIAWLETRPTDDEFRLEADATANAVEQLRAIVGGGQ